MTALRLSGIGHAYLGRTVLDRVDLAVGAGEIVALVGPSGCGKSTLIHVAAGIVQPLRGRVEIGYARHGMVFQEPRLMPWATARENIAYPLRLARIARKDRRARAEAIAQHVSLEPEDLDKFPIELSGGMRQRVAIARALASRPDFVYFDEPFTALDVALKRRLQDLVISAAQEARFGALFVTHDLFEAVRVAHRIAVMEAHGQGLVGERVIDGIPGCRADRTVFETVAGYLAEDRLFRHVNDIDERRPP
ncbi:MAG TPA: ATP-binding cassette domain-containing protein [Hyphomicrobiaceae bacterium]|nr:ATP-binding cassette domain-containing protein [Hyphomicrobiaceae bacterium]